MHIGKALSVVSLVCVLPLAACEEDEPKGNDDVVTDGAVSNGNDGSVILAPDGGTLPGHNDAGTLPTSNDAGTLPTSDGGVTVSTGSKFFLPTDEPTNTSAPRLVIDDAGNTHSVYPAFFRGDAFYSVCTGDCSDPSKIKPVRFETEGTVYNAMLRLTADGKPRILLASYAHNYYGECDAGCDERANWRFGDIQNHNGDLNVTGDAMALDPQGHPRFLIHAYKALFSIGQKTPQTSLASCDADCTKPESWRYDLIQKDEIWEGSTLRYDATGTGHIATNVVDYSSAKNPSMGAYLTCSGACNTENTWKGIGFFPVYESLTEAIDLHPSITLALTKAGKPRIAQLGKTPEGKKIFAYFECDNDCTGDNWKNGYAASLEQLQDGVGLALDKDDHPRLVNTLDYNIVLSYCNEDDCTRDGAEWTSTFVEKGDDIAADQIFLEWNCTFGAWFLHTPSIAVANNGAIRVGYQSRDISGGTSKPDPTKPGCTAGTDMTLSRLAALPAL